MHYTLHMTARCNLRCSYCYVDYGGDMTLETARAVVDLAGRDATLAAQKGSSVQTERAPLAVQESRSVQLRQAGLIFFGGEPLLLRDLITDTVAYARACERKGGGCRYFFKSPQTACCWTTASSTLPTVKTFLLRCQ